MRAKKRLKNMKNFGVTSNLIRSITKNSDNYNENRMETKFNLDDKRPLNKAIEIPSMIIVVRAISWK